MPALLLWLAPYVHGLLLLLLLVMLMVGVPMRMTGSRSLTHPSTAPRAFLLLFVLRAMGRRRVVVNAFEYATLHQRLQVV